MTTTRNNTVGHRRCGGERRRGEAEGRGGGERRRGEAVGREADKQAERNEENVPVNERTCHDRRRVFQVKQSQSRNMVVPH